MKILIAADMEGISGVVNWDQTDPSHAEYGRFRRIMTADVNAAIQGAFEGGATEVVVADGHNLATNILIEELDSRARLNTGAGSPFGMVQGIGPDVSGVFFIGYHARAGTQNAILDHTWSSRTVLNGWLNGALVGETGLNSAVCGHFGVPVLLLTGDQSVCAEATELLGPIETVQVKQANGRFSAECLPPAVSQQHIRQAAARAVQKLAAGKALTPLKIKTPVTVTLQVPNSDMADAVARLPGAVRLDARRIEFTAPDMPSAYIAFRAATALARA